MWTMTEQEIAERDKRIKELRQSATQVDLIQAILMDADVGGFGLHEDIAKKKAEAIHDAFRGSLNP